MLKFLFLTWTVMLGFAGSALADIITEWNAVFLTALRDETTTPPLAARNLAILQVAIYYAVNGITGESQSYVIKEPVD